jgi:hypothetical protein
VLTWPTQRRLPVRALRDQTASGAIGGYIGCVSQPIREFNGNSDCDSLTTEHMLLDRIRRLRTWRWNEERPPPTYDDLLRVAVALSRINAQLIERQFAISADAATVFMARLVEDSHFDEIGVDGWHYPLLCGEQLRRSRAARKRIEKSKVIEATVEQPILAADLNKRIEELEREGRALQARVKRLQNAGKTVITQREEWRTRALAAEDRLETERRQPMNPDKRFDALRRLIAKELHPDFCGGGAIEKLIRSECFKRLWPEIERIAEQGE